MTRPLALSRWDGLSGSGELAAAVENVRSAIAVLRRHPANRTGWPRTAAAASVRAARASAALDGAPLSLDTESTVVTDPVLAGALRVGAGLGALTGVWPRSPLQALARLHTLAAADLVGSADLGRPRTGDPAVGVRLAALANLVAASPWPAPVLVAVVHGELLDLRPFGHADGVVARAAARLTMMSSGLDPAGLAVPEVAALRSGARYRELISDLGTGRPGVADAWVAEVCRCLVAGAREGTSIADAAI